MSDTAAAKKRYYLDAMGIQVWRRRVLPDADTAQLSEVTAPVESGAEPGVDEAAARAVYQTEHAADVLDWPQLEARVAACTACELHQQRTQTVFGVGNRQAQWMVIGEAPGADEDRQGEPFVGKAGQLLNQMLQAIGLAREEVYIANIVKCRPPGNRDPKAEEVAACETFLKNQIALIKPKLILAVGRVAAQNLLHTDARVGQMRGKPMAYADTDIPVIVTYHPAYLLRSPLEKRKAWQDLLLARQVMAERS